MQKIIVTVTLTCLFILLGNRITIRTCSAGECDFLKAGIAKERNFSKRRALFRQAVEICGQDASLHYQFGYELERSRRYDEALVQYHKATELAPSMVKAYFNMGDIYQFQERFAEAMNAYQKGLELEPNNSRAQKNLKTVMRAAQGAP